MVRPGRKFVFTLETSLSILAVVSSFCAIGITLYQVYLQRIEHYAAALPYLMVSTTNFSENQTPYYSLSISNKGVGLAKIENLEIWYKKESIQEENKLIQKVFQDTVTARFFSHLWKGRIISPGEEFDWIKLDGPGAKLVEREFENGNIQYRVLFTSIYDEKWYLNLVSGKRLVEKVED